MRNLHPTIGDFYASFDRTFVISDYGKQVIELQLWSDGYDNDDDDDDQQEQPLDMDDTIFTPPWFYDLMKRGERIKFVRRGWLHTIIVTEVDD